MKSWGVWLGSAAVVVMTVAGIGGLAFYKYGQLQAAMSAEPPPEMPTSVTAATAQEISFRRHTTMIGTVLAPRSIVLSNEIAGTVAAIHFEPGQSVEPGQVLVELDISVERAQLDAAKARRTIAESAYRRIRDASASRAVTASELDEAVAQLAQATAQVNEIEAVIGRKTLRAPFRAKVGLSDTHVGQFLPSGFNITTLQGIEDYVFVDFMVPQSATDALQVGDEVRLLAHGQDNQEMNHTGQVTALDAQADRNSRNLMARVKVMQPAVEFLPGDSVKVLVEYGQPLNVPAVSPNALCSAPMDTFVYVLETNQKQELRAVRRTVRPGPTVGGKLTILEGLKVGEQVAVDGSFKLRPGGLVTLAPDEDEESGTVAASEESPASTDTQTTTESQVRQVSQMPAQSQ